MRGRGRLRGLLREVDRAEKVLFDTNVLLWWMLTDRSRGRRLETIPHVVYELAGLTGMRVDDVLGELYFIDVDPLTAYNVREAMSATEEKLGEELKTVERVCPFLVDRADRVLVAEALREGRGGLKTAVLTEDSQIRTCIDRLKRRRVKGSNNIILHYVPGGTA